MKKLYSPARDKLVKFDSIEEYCDYLEAIPAIISKPWITIGDGLKACVSKLRVGTTAYVKNAEAILSKMQDSHVFSAGLPTLQSSVMGFMPNIPAALAGHPAHMYSRAQSEMQGVNTPLNIYVEPATSGGLSNEQIVARGTAILAFVMAMSMRRPVEVYIAETNTTDFNPLKANCYGAAVKIDTKPLDLARFCWIITNNLYICPIGFATSADLYFKATGNLANWCSWSWGSRPQRPEYQQAIREIYEMQNDDVFIYGGHLTDNLMLTNPVEWVTQMIAEHSGAQQNA